MKICFLSLMNGSHWGGSEELWFRMGLWLAKQKQEVSVACYEWEGKKDRLDQLRAFGVTIHLLPRKKTLFSPFALKKAINTIPWEDYDLVFVNQGGYKEVVYPPFDQLYARMNKYILAFHNYDETETLSEKRVVSLQQWISNASLNVGAAGKIFDVLENNFGIHTEKKQVWPNPVTIDLPNSYSPFPGLINGCFHWSVLAELDLHRKAQDLLIETLASEKWRQRNWILHLYGRGKDELKIQKLIIDNHLEEKIILEGFQKNIKQVLEQTHVLIQCTRIDAMPLSVVEAMAMSRPCLVTNIGEMPAWVENGKNGWVCNELTIAELDSMLEKCWNDRENWEEMGRNAFDTFRKKYPIPYEEELFNRFRSIS